MMMFSVPPGAVCGAEESGKARFTWNPESSYTSESSAPKLFKKTKAKRAGRGRKR
jgi:hypothetical protein